MTSQDLLDRMAKIGTTSSAKVLSESPFFNQKDFISTDIPALNIALSGGLDGGITPGLLIIAGPSKHFKSMLALYMVRAYLNQYKDAICIYYDSEFGTTPQYFESLGIDTKRILHVPLEHIEQWKFDMVKKLEQIKKGDKVIFFLDSLGSLASKKEIDDATDERSVADMTRAKAIRSCLRIIYPHLIMKDLPMFAVNHVYDQIGALYPQKVMGGGTSIMYNSSTVWFMGKQQDKNGKDLVGFNFSITNEKSRFVKEKAKINLEVSFEHGISRYSGLLDIALETGHVLKPSNGWYTHKDDVKKFRTDDTNTELFWKRILEDVTFQDAVKQKYQLR